VLRDPDPLRGTGFAIALGKPDDTRANVTQLGASMASVAREAGVGIATLFRHFAAKEDLVAAVLADRMDAYAEAANQALADPDPWRGLAGFFEAVGVMQAVDSGSRTW
jgi:hypothetical protein